MHDPVVSGYRSPPTDTSRLELFRGLAVLRNDPGWASKFGLLCLALLSQLVIPLAGAIIIQGWTAKLVRQVVDREERELPPLAFDLDLLGKLLVTGFKPFIASFLWGLPAGLVLGLVLGGGYMAVIAAALATDGEALGPALAIFSVAMFVMVPVAALLQLPATVAGLRSELADDLNAGLEFGPVLGFTRQNLGPLLKGMLAYTVVGLVLVPFGLALCYVGVFPVVVALTIGWNVYLADAYRAHIARGGEPFPRASRH